MNRAQRRAQAKKRGRVTPKKEKVPKMFATVTDAEGNTKRVELAGEELTPAQLEAIQLQEARQREAQARLVAHAHGLWLPGDPT